jgi:hypothetical protein
MKKTPTPKTRRTASDDLRPEYHFDYRKARPNRFAGRNKDRVVVILDPDVSKVFTTSESVNTILRALIASMPQPAKRKAVDKSVDK